MLARLLEKLPVQQSYGKFTISAVVVDNDPERSAFPVVEEAMRKLPIKVRYFSQPEKNLSLSRNMALKSVDGEYAAFIDDDEIPVEHWLLDLYHTCQEKMVCAALGPVLAQFEKEPPTWIVRGKIFDRQRFSTGHELSWPETRTGNVLFNMEQLNNSRILFNPRFAIHGEDKDFFKRLIAKGYKCVWCDHAIVFEIQPAQRLTRTYYLRRALLRGSIAYTHAVSKKTAVAKSLTATLCYTLVLPILLFFGQHLFMKYLIKDCDHLGLLLASLGLSMEHRIGPV